MPVIAWMIVIYIASTDLLSAAHTSRFIGPFLRWFVPDISDATVRTVQVFVRKGGHLTEYAILAMLLCRALRAHFHRFVSIATIAFVVSAIYAAFDEFHQTFVSSRTGSPWDVVIDCTGAVIGVVIYRVAHSKMSSRKGPSGTTF